MDEVSHVCHYNDAIRQNISRLITGSLRKLASRKKKGLIKKEMISNPEYTKTLLANYRSGKVTSYNLEADPLGENIWKQAEPYLNDYLRSYHLTSNPTRDEICALVETVTDSFQDSIENHRNICDILYDGSRPRKEKAAQGIYWLVADQFCKHNNLDISPETNGGRGAVDFKFSRSYSTRVLAEIKLSTNPQLQHGYETQVREYEKAEKTDRTFLVVVNVLPNIARERFLAEKRTSLLRRTFQRNDLEGKAWPKVVIVDAFPKDSASKYKH
jgi:hypothetical protein